MKKVSIYAIGSFLSVSPAFALGGDDSTAPSNSKQFDSKLCESKTCTTEPADCPCQQSNEVASDAEPTLLGWLTKRLMEQPRFSATLSVQIKRVPDSAEKKLGSAAPTLQARLVRTSDEPNAEVTTANIAKPLTFSSTLTEGFEKLVDGVIACGHKICTDTQCIVIEDEGPSATSEEKSADTTEEPILIVPAAPPAPPVSHFANVQPTPPADELDAILDQSGLKQIDVPVSANQFVRLLVERAHLATRLEMTEQLMTERNVALEQIHALAERNASLAAQAAVAELKQQLAETLHAQLAEKAEIALKLAMKNESSADRPEKDSKVIQDIQEDLSNIRKQIGLLRRQSPVPFAPSYLGKTIQPYRPTSDTLAPSIPQEAKQIRSESESIVK